jgi:excisionase family DNA binding protein
MADPDDRLLTVGQAAQVLHLHVRTVRRLMREGKLPARKIGGQWRLPGSQLGTFTGPHEDPREPTKPAESATETLQGTPDLGSTHNVPSSRVSSVCDLSGLAGQQVERVASMLAAVMNTDDPDLQGARIDLVHHRDEGRLRILLWGTSRFVRRMLEMLEVLAP